MFAVVIRRVRPSAIAGIACAVMAGQFMLPHTELEALQRLHSAVAGQFHPLMSQPTRKRWEAVGREMGTDVDEFEDPDVAWMCLRGLLVVELQRLHNIAHGLTEDLEELPKVREFAAAVATAFGFPR